MLEEEYSWEHTIVFIVSLYFLFVLSDSCFMLTVSSKLTVMCYLSCLPFTALLLGHDG